MAIAIGLGLGADQGVPTMAAMVLILTVVALYKWSGRKVDQKSMFLSVRYDQKQGDANFLHAVNETIKKHVTTQDMRRVDTADDQVEATFFVDIEHEGDLVTLLDELRKTYPGIDLTFIDQNRLPSV